MDWRNTQDRIAFTFAPRSGSDPMRQIRKNFPGRWFLAHNRAAKTEQIGESKDQTATKADVYLLSHLNPLTVIYKYYIAEQFGKLVRLESMDRY